MLNQLKQKLTDHWNQYALQIVGLILLVIPSLIAGFLQEWGYGFALLVIILAYDLVLIKLLDKVSITKYTRNLLPGWADKLVMIAVFILIVTLGTGGDSWGTGYWFIQGTINGHLNWEK